MRFSKFTSCFLCFAIIIRNSLNSTVSYIWSLLTSLTMVNSSDSKSETIYYRIHANTRTMITCWSLSQTFHDNLKLWERQNSIFIFVKEHKTFFEVSKIFSWQGPLFLNIKILLHHPILWNSIYQININYQIMFFFNGAFGCFDSLDFDWSYRWPCTCNFRDILYFFALNREGFSIHGSC